MKVVIIGGGIGVRTGILLNRPGGQHLITVTQQPLPLSARYRIVRADVADVFVAALKHPRTVRATFEAVWGRRGHPQPFSELLDRLQPNPPSNAHWGALATVVEPGPPHIQRL